uniref:Fibronectin type III domain-containing protein n=1 Tax=Anopheles atroparvus TaxID=41427 RepID=A0AAG5DFD0_ANOAO
MAHGSLFHAEQHSHRQPLLGGPLPPPSVPLANHKPAAVASVKHQHHVHPLLQRHRSEDRPPLRPITRHGHAGGQGVGTGCHRHAPAGGLSKPLLGRPPLAHSHSVGQHQHHAPHHHRSHPRLSQQHRQKLFSRSKQYTSVCSGGSNSTHYAGDSGTRSRSSREHADDDVESCPYHPWPEEPSSVISERCTRARINSAIFVSSEGKGFDSIEFIRRYGSQSVLCRKAKSAENVSASERQVSVLSVLCNCVCFGVCVCCFRGPRCPHRVVLRLNACVCVCVCVFVLLCLNWPRVS